jgi:uncharacterized protein YfeS
MENGPSENKLYTLNERFDTEKEVGDNVEFKQLDVLTVAVAFRQMKATGRTLLW